MLPPGGPASEGQPSAVLPVASGAGSSVPCAKSLQPHPTLCDPMDYRPPGSSVHGVLQARIPEWVAVPFSKGIFLTLGSNPHLIRLLCWQAGFLFFFLTTGATWEAPLTPAPPIFFKYFYDAQFNLMTLKKKKKN